MSVFRIYHVKLFATIAAVFLLAGYALFGVGIYAYFHVTTNWFVYVLVVWALYIAYGTYYLFRQIYWRFHKYTHATGLVKKGIVTYRLRTETQDSLRPLVDVYEDESSHTYALVGLFSSSFNQDFPEGTPVDVFVYKGNEGEALFLSSNVSIRKKEKKS